MGAVARLKSELRARWDEERRTHNLEKFERYLALKAR